MTEDLARAIETGPASRELSDRVLIACGCVPEHHILPKHTKWRLPSGPRFVPTPDPLKDLNVVAALERECGATVAVRCYPSTIAIATSWIGSTANTGRQGRCEGDHAECRARAASLLRALEAAGRTPVDAS